MSIARRSLRNHPLRRSEAARSRARGGASLGIVLVMTMAIGLWSCADEELLPPSPDAGPLFTRVVAIGNSITAGFQSGGINDSTQQESYAALVAAAMGTEFDIPLLNAPGCPPPIVDIFTQTRISDLPGDFCALRTRPIPTELNNVAVPGAEVIDVLTNFAPQSSPNPLTTLLLGGRSQLQAAAELQPTFAMVWIGNNDVLGAALNGDAQLATNPAAFAARYGLMADSLLDIGIDGAVLVAVVNVTLSPHLSPGVAYWQAEGQGALPPTFDVLDNCGPAALGGVGESTLVPFGYGFGVLLAQAAQGQPVTLDCVNDDPVLTATEGAQIQGFIAAFNQTIADVADANGWAFYDPNPLLQSLKDQGEIPLFPNTTGNDAIERPFGDILSKDGVHPSGVGHRLIAEGVIEAINAHYDTTIPTPLTGGVARGE